MIDEGAKIGAKCTIWHFSHIMSGASLGDSCNIGQNVMVNDRRIIGIFDLDNTTSSIHTRKFLERAEKEGRVVDVSGDLPKSFTVCRTGKGPPTVYLSQLSSATLLKRVENNTFE